MSKTKAEPQDEIKNLVRVNETLKKFTLPNFIKPCVALMLQDGFEKGGDFSRDRVCYIISTEMRRIGKSENVTAKILQEWDRGNEPPLGLVKIRAKINSAYRTNYTFGCSNEPVLLEYCQKINRDFCKYYQAISPRKRKGSDRDFIKYGWPQCLSPSARLVYILALPEIEKRRGLRAGERIFASHREISKICGVTRTTIGEILQILQEKGLITYKTGQPYRWRVEASEIKRIIPIPKPKGKAL